MDSQDRNGLLWRRRLRRGRGSRLGCLAGVSGWKEPIHRYSEVKGVQIAIAEDAVSLDHLVKPEEAIAMALARQ
jgi:hypothetical protein